MNKVAIKKQQVIQQVTQYLIENGLSDMGLRKLAAVADTSDRMLIYYFGTKDELMEQVLHSIASGFTAQLDAILGQHQRQADTLIGELLILSDSREFSPFIRLWFEVVGFAARGRSPYAKNATAIATNWLAWIESRLENPRPNQAIAVLAEVEGKLMLKLLGLAVT
ncbi:MAG: TetR/AcrR family transcriptional regulator [Chloroflexota bacterium]